MKVGFDVVRVCMSERIAKSLCSDVIDLVAHDRPQRSRCAVNLNSKSRSRRTRVFDVRVRGGQVFSERAQRLSEIIGVLRSRAEILNRVPSVPNRLRSVLEGRVQSRFCIQWTLGQNVCG